MTETKKLGVRLALRVEGDWWVAYLALENTMDGAKRLGSILMGIVENSHERRQAFQSLMQDVMNDAIKDVFGQTPDWNAPQSAPEAERAGRA
jgi:hypothetical protein